MPVAGSIQSDVPVKPVCPNDPTGSSSPRLDEYDESMSQPSPRTFGIVADRRARHLRDRQRREDARAVVGAAGEQHPAEDRQIGGRAEETGVAGHAAHPPRRRIVDDAAQHLRLRSLAGPCEGQAALGRRDARPQARGRQEHRVLHAERIEDLLLRELVERLAAHAPNDVAEQEEVDVAVDEPLAGRRRRHFLDGERDRGVRPGPGVAEIEVGPEARTCASADGGS